jgi:hypothetical protein
LEKIYAERKINKSTSPAAKNADVRFAVLTGTRRRGVFRILCLRQPDPPQTKDKITNADRIK